MTESSETVTFGGVLTSGVSGAVFALEESTVMLLLSLTGIFVSVVGLAYTVWKGERNYRLQMRSFEANMEKRFESLDDN